MVTIAEDPLFPSLCEKNMQLASSFLLSLKKRICQLRGPRVNT